MKEKTVGTPDGDVAAVTVAPSIAREATQEEFDDGSSLWPSKVPTADPDKAEGSGLKLPSPGSLNKNLVTFPIIYVHDILAEQTGYEGWRVTSEEREYWDYLAEFAIQNLPMKYLVPIIMLGGLAVIEGKKVVGFMTWRKDRQAVNPGTTNVVPPDGASR